jgi:Rad3-related DNA helicase
VTGAPAIEVVGRAPGRVLKRLWEPPASQDALARTIILTSATLATPSFAAESRWRTIEIATGIDPTAANILSDLATTIEPKQFGTLRFRFADPKAPVPRIGCVGDADPAATEYAAAVIEAARNEVAPHGRTLVLVPAYDDVERLAPLLRGCTSHRQGTPLSDVLASYARTPGTCLITPAAGVGANLPGMVQALVIPRLPYPPSDNGNGRMVAVIADMLGKLAQGIGRAIRRPSDVATVWFADPRMPIPECITEELGILPSPHANRVAVSAIPSRFRQQFGRIPGVATIGVSLPAALAEPSRSRPYSDKPRRKKVRPSAQRPEIMLAAQ